MSKVRKRLKVLCALMIMLVSTSGLFADDFSGWLKRMPITFSGYTKSEDLVNFPALIVLEETEAGVGFKYSDFLSPPFDDLRFVAEDLETPLNFEVESWDVNGQSFVWVQIPELAPNTKIYALWGKADEELLVPASSVWDDSYKSVLHLNDDTNDATENQNHATNYNAVRGTGIIGGGYDFRRGEPSYLDTPSNVKGYGITDSFTFSCWFKTRLTSSQVLIEDGTSYGNISARLRVSGTKVALQVYTPSRAFNDNLDVGTVGTNWHHIALVYNGKHAKMYFDSVEKWSASLTGDVKDANSRLQLGCAPNGASAFFEGVMDEARLSSVGRSADWIWAC
ncbi:MAG: DUF2341 domain-containing protein, partial [Lentisphaerae bacterium]|nr:DUF2341 domain-containing protein [Lentisphaerota bacterium]